MHTWSNLRQGYSLAPADAWQQPACRVTPAMRRGSGSEPQITIERKNVQSRCATLVLLARHHRVPNAYERKTYRLRNGGAIWNSNTKMQIHTKIKNHLCCQNWACDFLS